MLLVDADEAGERACEEAAYKLKHEVAVKLLRVPNPKPPERKDFADLSDAEIMQIVGKELVDA